MKEGSRREVANGMGWLHRLNGKRIRSLASSLSPLLGIGVTQTPRLTPRQCRDMQIKFDASLKFVATKLDALATSLGLAVEHMVQFNIGRDVEHERWTWPMFGRHRQVVGFSVRYASGRKSAILGSSMGCFLSRDYIGRGRMVYVTEGASSSATVHQLGHVAIGRPSACGGLDMLPHLLDGAKGVVICAENEKVKWRGSYNDADPFWPGMEGALICARVLHTKGFNVSFLRMPKGIKDIRDLKISVGAEAAAAHLLTGEGVTQAWLDAATMRLAKRRLLFKSKGKQYFEDKDQVSV
jgi:hypothetical protein